jgi:hypothetical protein
MDLEKVPKAEKSLPIAADFKHYGCRIIHH